MKRLSAFLIAAALSLSLVSCTTAKGSDAKPSSSPVPEVTPSAKPAEVNLSASELSEKLKEILGESYGCTVSENEAKALGYFGLDKNLIDSWVSECNAVSSVNMDQAVILKVKEGYAEQAAAALQKGFEQKIGYARLYNMDLFRMGEARLFKEGNYVALLILGKRPDVNSDSETQAAFSAEEGKKIDSAWKSIFGTDPENIIVIPDPSESGGGMVPGGRPGGGVVPGGRPGGGVVPGGRPGGVIPRG